MMEHQHDGEGGGGGGEGSMKVFDAVTALIKKKHYKEASECVKMAMQASDPGEEIFLEKYGFGMVVVSETLHYGNLRLPNCSDEFYYHTRFPNQDPFDYYSVLHLPPSSQPIQVKDCFYKLRDEIIKLINIGFHGATFAKSLLYLAKSNLCDETVYCYFNSKRREDFVFLDWPQQNETAAAAAAAIASYSFKERYLNWKPPVYHVDVLDHMKYAYFRAYVNNKEVVDTGKEVGSNDDDEEEEESSDDEEEDASFSPVLRILKKKVFDEMPQNPHYTPLEKYTGKVREGMILGLEVAFTKLCEEIRNLVDLQSFWNGLDGFNEQLSQLKEMGYNVEKVSQRIDILKGIGDSERASRVAAEKFENEVRDREANVIDLQTRISELQTEIEESKSKIQTFKKDSSYAGAKFAATVKSKWV